MRAIYLAPLILIAGCAAGDQRAQQAAVASVEGEAVGKPRACLSTREVRQIKSANDYVALFHTPGNKVYRNDLGGRCQRIGDDIIVHTSPTGRYCSGDVLRLVDRHSGFPGSICRLGKFVEWQFPEKDVAEGDGSTAEAG